MSTVGQLKLSYKLKLDKIDSSAYPDIQDSEIAYWLDEAADRFVKQRYERNNIKKYTHHESIIYEPEKCIRCGLCIDIASKDGFCTLTIG